MSGPISTCGDRAFPVPQLISMLLEFSSKAAAEKSQATTSSGPPPVPMQRHVSTQCLVGVFQNREGSWTFYRDTYHSAINGAGQQVARTGARPAMMAVSLCMTLLVLEVTSITTAAGQPDHCSAAPPVVPPPDQAPTVSLSRLSHPPPLSPLSSARSRRRGTRALRCPRRRCYRRVARTPMPVMSGPCCRPRPPPPRRAAATTARDIRPGAHTPALPPPPFGQGRRSCRRGFSCGTQIADENAEAFMCRDTGFRDVCTSSRCHP